MNTVPNYIWPIIFIIIQCYSWFKTPKESTTVNIWPILAFLPISIFIMFKGGFFDAWFWPQYLWIVFECIGLIMVALCHFFHIEINKKQHEFTFTSLVIFLFVNWIYYSGGMYKYLL